MSTSIGNTLLTYPSGATQSTIAVDYGQLINISVFTPQGVNTYQWTNPGATTVQVKLVGAGGGAAGYCESGGAGGYAEGFFNVTGVATVSVTIGSGGAAVGYYAAAGQGGTTSFGSYLSATGGYGANQNYTHSGGHGGAGSGGQTNLQGGAGGGHVNHAGSNTMGRGGYSYFGGATALVRNHANNSLYGPMPGGAPGTGAPGLMTDGYYESLTSQIGKDGIVIVYAYK